MKSCRWGQVASAAVLLTMLASPVHADALADARKAVAGSDYLTAQPALEEALKAGTSGPEDLAEIYRLTGIVQGALGNEAAAEKAFGKWLALEPRGSLPPGTSPKITRPFDAAAIAAKKKGPLAAKAETTDDPPTVTLVVVRDPMKMIVGAKVYFSKDKQPEEMLRADGSKRVTIDLGTGKRIDLRLHAVDEYGNRVVELGSKDVPIVITSTGQEKRIDPKDRDLLRTQREAQPAEPRPLVLEWWLWGGATVVAAGVGGYFAWRTKTDVDRLEYLNANSLSHTWAQAQDVESSARTNLLVTNIAAGAAGAFAIGAAILFFTRQPQDGGSERELRATVTPTRGGGAFVVGGHF